MTFVPRRRAGAGSLLFYGITLLPMAILPRQASTQQTASRDTGNTHLTAAVPLFRPRDLLAVAGLAGAVAVVMRADQRIERAFQRSSVQTNWQLRKFSDAAGALGDPGSVVVSAALYFSGLGLRSRKLAALGMHSGESVVLGGLIAEGLKGEIGRARPKISPDDSHVFRTGRGFSSDDYGSFPSAETTAAFAMMSSMSRGINRDWPGHSRWVTPIAYTTATLVAASRLYKNEHWASDVVAAGGLGTFSGIFVDRFNQRYRDNIFERVFLPESIVPLHHRFVAVWTRSL